MENPQINDHHFEPQPLPVDPIPFDYAEHARGIRYRRSSHNCYKNGTQYILFVLDTSGSIGPYYFEMVTETLSKLVHRFCKPIKIAAMTFSGSHSSEFCFDCYDNDCDGRDNARDAMRNITYRGGLTYTGGATYCVCNFMLTPACGFPDLVDLGEDEVRCLDVVYLTDGWSNGPIPVQDAVNCLHNLENTDLNVFAIGIGNRYNIQELSEITRSTYPLPDTEKDNNPLSKTLTNSLK